MEETEKQKPEPSQKVDKVGDAIDFLNDVFVDDTMQSAAPGTKPTPKVNFKKSNIDTIYDLPDEKKKPFLKLVVFKPKAYAVISAIKNVPNPPILYYSPGKFDEKNPPVGLVTYLQEFIASSIRYGDMAPENPEDEDGDRFRDDGSGPVGGPRYLVYSYKTVLKSWTNT